MNVKAVKPSLNELALEVEGESHTLCNMLQKTLLEDETVELAGYDKPHPLVDRTLMYVRTKGRRKPKTALIKATKKNLSQSKAFGKAFKTALDRWYQK
jgi:DNA-directed RNA polymerase subunit L